MDGIELLLSERWRDGAENLKNAVAGVSQLVKFPGSNHDDTPWPDWHYDPIDHDFTFAPVDEETLFLLFMDVRVRL